MRTAPKDGTLILVSEGPKYQPFIAHWGYCGRFTNSPKMWIGHEYGAMDEGSLIAWMHIPEPPQEAPK